MIDWDNPAEVLEHFRSIEWYVVTITGTNKLEEEETRSVQMSGDIEHAVKAWAQHNAWTCAHIVEQQYLGPVPPTEQFN